MYMPSKKKIKPKSNTYQANKPTILIVNLGYLNYLKNKAYKYYMDNSINSEAGLDTFESQMVFTAHFFTNYVDQEHIENRQISIHQDNMYSTLNNLSNTIFTVATETNMIPEILVDHFFDTQDHIDKSENFKLNGIKSLVMKRVLKLKFNKQMEDLIKKAKRKVKNNERSV